MESLEQLYARYGHAMATRDLAEIENIVQEVSALAGPEAEALTHLLRSGYHHVSVGYANAIEEAAEARRRYRELGDDRGVIRSNVQLLLNYQALGDHTPILELCHETLHLNERVQEPNIDGGVLNAIGLTYRETGDYPSAIQYLEQALAIFTKQGNRAFMANAICNIGGLYFYLDQHKEALRYLEEGVAMQREVGNVEYDVGQSLALAKVLLNLGRLDEGERLMTETYHRAIDLGIPDLIATAVIDVARHALIQRRFEEALELLESQRTIIDPLTMWSLERDTVYSTALANLEQFDTAKAVLQAAIERATALNYKAHLQNYHRILRDIAKAEGDFDAYIKHNDLQQSLTDQLKGADAARKMALLESERTITALNQERERERAVLYSTLPQHVADRVIRGEQVNDAIDHAAVLFADVVGFTTHSSTMDPKETTSLLAHIFDAFDALCQQHGVVKIKTIGDSYMAVAFPDIGDQLSDIGPEQRAANTALAMQESEFYWPSATAHSNRLQFRIGIHSGPVVAGVVGKERLQYDVWGDTVNVASRMESTGEPGRIQVSSAFATALGNGESGMGNAAEARVIPSASEEPHSPLPITYSLRERGAVEVKGKGTMTTYWLESASAP